MGEIGSIATHTCLATIKQRRLRQVVGVVEPVPIWLVTLVAAFFTKCCLVRIGDVSVPGQEISLMGGKIKINCELFRESVIQ